MRLAGMAAALLAVGVLAFEVADAAPAARPGPARGNWVGSWEAAPGSAGRVPANSIRNVVHLSVGGTALRVHLSNAFGIGPLHLDDASVAVAAGPNTAEALTGTVRPLTFHFARTITVAAGASVVSDPVSLPVRPGATLLVSTYTAGAQPLTFHSDAQQTSYLAPYGDHTGDESGIAYTGTVRHWFVVDGIDVRAVGSRGAVVAFGDSITDGYRSGVGANRRWPDDLARRLAPRRIGVLNAGISGNRLLRDGDAPGGPGATSGQRALARFDRDVLRRTGVRTVILLEGVNDIGQRPQQAEPARIEAALRRLAAAARAHGLRVVGGTLTPLGGSVYDTRRLEAVRTAVNRWIRATPAFDAVVDFDAAIRDPAHPQRMRPRYDSGDHLHPGDAGYQAMSDAVDGRKLTG
jgi:lysophospholipase L1-like esterase